MFGVGHTGGQDGQINHPAGQSEVPHQFTVGLFHFQAATNSGRDLLHRRFNCGQERFPRLIHGIRGQMNMLDASVTEQFRQTI